MATITSTEAGASGRYINLGSPASQDGFGAQTVIAYCKPGTQTTNGYLFGKCSATATFGPRFFATMDGTVVFGADSSGVALQPESVTSANAATPGAWQHYQATWDGAATGIVMEVYVGSGPSVTTFRNAGSGSVTGDALQDLYLMNRPGLGREFIGDVAYVARWSRVLTDAERTTVRTSGPLDVPTGLTLCWANDQDYSTNTLAPVSRSTRVTGSLPTNTALGGTVVAPSLGLSESLGGHALNETALNREAGTFAGISTSQAQQATLSATRSLSASVASSQDQSATLSAQRTGVASLNSSQGQEAAATTLRTLVASLSSAQGQMMEGGQGLTSESSQAQSAALETTRSLTATVQSSQVQEASSQAQRGLMMSVVTSQGQSAQAQFWRQLQTFMATAQAQSSEGYAGRQAGASFYVSMVAVGNYRSSVVTAPTTSFVPLDATESLVEN